MLINGKLHIARSGKNINKSLTVGFNSDFAQATAGISKVDKDIATQSIVTSIYDAVAHLYGREPKLSKGGPNWYKPDPSIMSEITGALTFLSVILTGKVKPYGKFMSVVPKPKCPAEYENADLQPVCFDLPISYGLAYTTFAKEFQPNSGSRMAPVRDFCTVGIEQWDPGLNYMHPVVVGGPRDDEAVRKAVFLCDVERLSNEFANMFVREAHHCCAVRVERWVDRRCNLGDW